MRTYDRICDPICCKIRILHIFPHIIAFSKLYTRKLCRICENSHIFAHLRITCDRIFQRSTVKSKLTITRHTVRYRLLSKVMSSLQSFIRHNCQSDTVHCSADSHGRSQDFSLMGSQVERQRHDNQRAEGCEEGEWVSLSALGVRSGEGCAPSPEMF